MAQRLITIREAAEYTGLAVSTLYSWVWQKRVPYVKLGRAVRFDLADLDRLIQLRRVEAGSNLPGHEDLPQERG